LFAFIVKLCGAAILYSFGRQPLIKDHGRLFCVNEKKNKKCLFGGGSEGKRKTFSLGFSSRLSSYSGSQKLGSKVECIKIKYFNINYILGASQTTVFGKCLWVQKKCCVPFHKVHLGMQADKSAIRWVGEIYQKCLEVPNLNILLKRLVKSSAHLLVQTTPHAHPSNIWI
jgi:hypothetical protein